MAAAKGAKAKLTPDDEATPTLSAEDRRRRVENVRKLDADLQRVEYALLAAKAQLPGLIEEVQQARGVIAKNTAPAGGDETAAASA